MATITPKKLLSLRRPKVCGSLSMRYIYSLMEFFFLFYESINYWWFMDCFVISLLAMTKGQMVVNSFSFCFLVRGSVVMDCFASLAMTKKRTVIARVAFATRGNLVMIITTLNPHRHCEALKNPWQSQYSNYYTQQTIVIAKAEGLWQSRYSLARHCDYKNRHCKISQKSWQSIKN